MLLAFAEGLGRRGLWWTVGRALEWGRPLALLAHWSYCAALSARLCIRTARRSARHGRGAVGRYGCRSIDHLQPEASRYIYLGAVVIVLVASSCCHEVHNHATCDQRWRRCWWFLRYHWHDGLHCRCMGFALRTPRRSRPSLERLELARRIPPPDYSLFTAGTPDHAGPFCNRGAIGSTQPTPRPR